MNDDFLGKLADFKDEHNDEDSDDFWENVNNKDKLE